MQFIRPFKNFDPINGELRENTPPVIHYYLKIARELLVNRNLNEIEYAISTINYLLHGGRELFGNSNLNKEDEIANNDIKTTSIEEVWDQIHSDSKHFTPSSLLYSIYRNIDIEIDGQEDFKNAKWAEYFAALALAEIAELHEADFSSLHITEISSRSSEIAEAIAFAKTSSDLANLAGKSSHEVLSLVGSKGGIETNREFNNVKDDYFLWFDEEYGADVEDDKVNFTAAARKYYNELVRPMIKENDKHPMAAQKEENALRMLRTALRERRKLKRRANSGGD